MPWGAIFARVVTALFVLISCAAPACDTACALGAGGASHCAAAEKIATVVHGAMGHHCMGGMHRQSVEPAHCMLPATWAHAGCGHEAPAVLKSPQGLRPPQMAVLLAIAPGVQAFAASDARTAEGESIFRSRLSNDRSDVLRI